ncbi:16S rRNA (cytosine(967)-C(5))-methyltransferase RsmB [Weissella hellenica]|uniref:16S rRNA (cytosine(967)-C(5))-methyltransferase n=1 Tax=Weissella hellenica TaxID=46256 RepID=A0A4Y4G0X6_WEIHE|nr:16S rRNA (cytosine(967)-C(5))-methyltransferase RsmB [Weissella hellenica]NKY67028.1 16S rRNA (cytosine(967)-C(5))-methyltransferase RsmB [Weissella hellenica]GED36042.1 ribosomal RNA small subunit methyltransferase B [Weissella hellenica]SCB96440.1 16S rRNA (cytosine967-C5)-methyltransferase [Weissella hellenica]
MSNKTNQKIANWEQTNPRALAVRVLEKVNDGAYSNLQLNSVIKQANLSEKNVHLMTTMVYGVIQHRLTLEYWLKPFVKRPQKLNPWVRELLFISLYQMQYLDKIPDHAIFDEAINLAKRRGHDGIRKFVTGVLHAIQRQGLPDIKVIDDPVEQLSIQSSLPIWLIQTLQDQLGWEKTVAIAGAINGAPAQSVRINHAVTTGSEVTELLEEAGFNVEPSHVTPDALLVSGGHVASSQLFKDGLLTLQDESAMLMVPSLVVTPTDQVLDAAAAPGGKTTQIATYLDVTQGGKVTALDIHEHKAKLIKENALRLHVADRIETQVLDARKVDEKFANETFDRILVDAPCSGFGLLRRKPEIRYEKSLDDSYQLQKVQKAILDAVANKLKKGGRLVYGTCTILKTENEDVIDAFLADHDNFRLVPTQTALDLDALDERGMLHIYPDDFGSDGFFVATLVKQ